jgi:hypothetical protein
MSIARLGNYTFRINPSQVFFSYDVDTTVINTVGGRVVQAYGATLGDITVQGLFGQERSGKGRPSWKLAEEFQDAIGQMVVAQSRPPTPGQLAGYDGTPMHQPIRFLFNDDSPERRASGLPLHNWDMMVYIKALRDTDGNATMVHETGKFSYGYTLTLFFVEDNTGKLITTVLDQFIQRLSEGIGWQRTPFNGMMSKDELKAYLDANSPDGTIHGLVLKNFRETATPGADAAKTNANQVGINDPAQQPAPISGTGTATAR